jgi:hypothetical protein
MPRRRKAFLLVAAVALLALAGALAWRLARRPLSDRAQIEQLLARAQSAVHTKDAKLGLSCISADYRDSFGLNKWVIARYAHDAARGALTFRLLISDLSLSINRDQAQGRIQLEVLVRNGDVVQQDLSGPITLGFRKERGGWKIISSGGWQDWVEG